MDNKLVKISHEDRIVLLTQDQYVEWLESDATTQQTMIGYSKSEICLEEDVQTFTFNGPIIIDLEIKVDFR